MNAINAMRALVCLALLSGCQQDKPADPSQPNDEETPSTPTPPGTTPVDTVDSSTGTTGTTGDTATAPTSTRSYQKLAAGRELTCALLDDGEIRCAGSTRWAMPAPPAGPFVDVAAGWDTACGIRTDGTIECWGCDWLSTSCNPPRSGGWVAVDGCEDHWCALDAAGNAACWDYYSSGPAPGVAYSSFAVGVTGFVGVRASDGEVDAAPEAGEPEGPLVEVGASRSATCGIRATDGTTVCESYPGPPLPDDLVSIDGYDMDFCWLDQAGHVDCAANHPDAARDGFDPAVETFASVSAGAEHACAVTVDGRGYCWPHNGKPETSGVLERPQ